MEIIALTPQLDLLRIGGWQLYRWRDGDRVTLIDTGAPGGEAELAAAVPGLERIVLTHFHADHVGAAPALRSATSAEVVAGAGDAEILRGAAEPPPADLADWEVPLLERTPKLPWIVPVDVDTVAGDGDTLDFGGGAQVLAVPGHTAGSIAIYLPRHKILFTGDTIASADGRVILGVFNQDRALAAESMRRQAELDVEIACFGHGDPVTSGAGKRLREAAAELPGGMN